MNELLQNATEIAVLWGTMDWPSRIAMLAPVVISGASTLSALLPYEVSDKSKRRIEKTLKGIHYVSDLMAINVGNAKRKKGKDDANL